ncbi:YfgM family protein [Dickeya lacustris]|uniref:Ancillary SecYEG translocon subunit n=1 Tax=Dickeya lacustris TaxID=2259638 RepID=A0ABY8GA81_9GAMM|nr:YfgM family protein [Dickeya lacustris]WFN56882.1 YfgM family protein [Dickeya lacustris]
MEVYTTENEQIDALRRFFIENGKALAIGVVLGIGALVGWRLWQNHQENSTMAASAAYQQVTESLSGGTAEGIASAEQFAAGDHGNYGAFAALALAHQFVEKNDVAKAEQQLRQAQGLTKDGDLQALIALRLARVQLQQKKPDDALKTLEAIKSEGWLAMVSDVRGDVLVSKGDSQGARDAYNKAMAAKPSQGLQSLLRIKLNNLPS